MDLRAVEERFDSGQRLRTKAPDKGSGRALTALCAELSRTQSRRVRTGLVRFGQAHLTVVAIEERSSCTSPERRVGGTGSGLAIARSTVYKVFMTTRAMQEATFMILTALAKGSQHGYGIITDVLDISGGRVRLRAGTLYTALDRLRADELIGVDREEVMDGRLRRYYRLTPAGTKLLADEAARLQAHAAVALRRLNLAGGMAT